MPNRIIKESIRTSKSVNTLPDFLFRVWVYLITYVDDYGRGSADPQLLKCLVFPRNRRLSEEKMSEAMRTLAGMGMIRLYEVDGEPYFCFPTWDEHQRIRAKKSNFPEPDSGGQQMTADDGTCPRNPIQSNPNQNPNQNQNPIQVCDARAEEPAEEAGADGANADSPEDGAGPPGDDRWEEFWAAYPRKIGGSIDAACAEYLAAVAAGVEPELLIRKARELAEDTPPARMRYIPAAEKWLRNKGWLQEQQAADAKTNNPFLRMYEEEHGQ